MKQETTVSWDKPGPTVAELRGFLEGLPADGTIKVHLYFNCAIRSVTVTEPARA